MFGIGTSELILIGIVAILVVGPEKLPGIMRTMGKVLAEFKRMSTDVKSTIDSEMRRLEEDERKKELELARKKAAEQAAAAKAAAETAEAGTATAEAPAAEPASPAATTKPDAAKADSAKAESVETPVAQTVGATEGKA